MTSSSCFQITFALLEFVAKIDVLVSSITTTYLLHFFVQHGRVFIQKVWLFFSGVVRRHNHSFLHISTKVIGALGHVASAIVTGTALIIRANRVASSTSPSLIRFE